MLGQSPKLQDSGIKPLPSAKKLAVGIALGWMVFVVTYLYAWEHLPEHQLILNRISWSSADFVSLAATALALYSYYLFQRSSQSEDMMYLQKFILACKKAGIDPDQIEVILRQTNGVVDLVTRDPETAKRIEQATFRILRERYAGLAKLNDEEMYETLRSLIR